MATFRIEELALADDQIDDWGTRDCKHKNWPVVYTLDMSNCIYVGESLNAEARLHQHRGSPQKRDLKHVRVVVDETFNKSACLDLESRLIRLLAGDEKYTVLNLNTGITDADYYHRADYQATFDSIFEALRTRNVFTRSIAEIENTDLFKLSPFKALTPDQSTAVDHILEDFFADVQHESVSRAVVQGDPGTGKTVVGIYLMKLLSDIQAVNAVDPEDIVDRDASFSEFFLTPYPSRIADFRIGLVVPQQSLRASIRKVFSRTPGLSADMVLTPFEVGEAEERFDLLIVDETHRLNRRANQSSATNNKRFADINQRLYHHDDLSKTQIDWILDQSDHQIFLLDVAQSVRPADVSRASLDALVQRVPRRRRYTLTTQMRVRGGEDYVKYVRRILSDDPPSPQAFGDYDFRFFSDLGEMLSAVRERNRKFGLARLVAGYAWPWNSKRDRTAFDIELDGVRLRWNSRQRDWISSPDSTSEVGSIHTVQGYDLNYAGVIIGNDLRYDARSRRLVFDRSNYHDKKGMENNRLLGITYEDADILQFVAHIYAVLLTRGMRGTFVYACDPALRDYLRSFFPEIAPAEVSELVVA